MSRSSGLPGIHRAVYVCICNGVTDHQIREAAASGVRSMAELTMRTGCGATCGTCLDTASGILILEASRVERGNAFPVPMLAAGIQQAA
jgi:bacterioferritin-associated ferredoxin